MDNFNDYNPDNKPLARPKKKVNPIRVVMPIAICLCIVLAIVYYSHRQMAIVTSFAEYTVQQLGDSAAAEIESTYGYAVNSIKAVAAAVSESMTSQELKDPSGAISPLIETTPFGSIEYIRPDGMNVMNIGQPFDASEREYYINGIKGISGVWNNYHPKIAEETLMNFYTPLIYQGNIAGVITGYIRATSQVLPLLESEFFSEPTQGLLYDRQGMVICSSVESEFEKDLTIEKLLSGFSKDQTKHDALLSLLNAGIDGIYSYYDNDGEGRVYIKGIDGTDWEVAIFIPAQSYNAVIEKSLRPTYIAVGVIILLALAYVFFIIIQNRKEKIRYAHENAQLEFENRQFNVQNTKAFKELSELNAQLEESAAEQESQIEEISALNSELEERQAQLEKATAEQKAHIEEISQLNDRLSQQNDIVASAGLGIWYIYLKNDAAPRMKPDEKMRELLGIEGMIMSEEEIYSFWHERILPDALESVNNSVSKIVSGVFDENTYQWNHPAKGVIYVRCGGNAITLSDGTIVLSGYHADVTDIVFREKKQQEALEKARDAAEVANNAKTAFLFNMSHDIRTPMNAILGFRDLLEKHQEEPEKRADYLKKIEESSNVLLSIINNVLEMARIEKGTIEMDESVWSAEQFNDTLYTIFDEMMKEKGITFSRQIDVKNPYVYCDPIKLREVFINILSNAYKYTNAGGSVNMHLEEIPSEREGYAMYRTTITDTGIGMSEAYLPHIFEEFSRENTSTENKIEGTGLGMPIVKRLVGLMEGTIEVKSQKGVGSTFIVTIPHRIAEKSNHVEHSGVEIDPELFVGKRILLAEDNELNAEIAMEILGEAGFIVDLAEDGAICCGKLSSAEDGYYDLILMDIQMPNMNGYEATRTIRKMQDSAKANIPILAMTANAFEEDKREALRAGMNGHLAKPINVPELMKALAGILG